MKKIISLLASAIVAITFSLPTTVVSAADAHNKQRRHRTLHLLVGRDLKFGRYGLKICDKQVKSVLKLFSLRSFFFTIPEPTSKKIFF